MYIWRNVNRRDRRKNKYRDVKAAGTDADVDRFREEDRQRQLAEQTLRLRYEHQFVASTVRHVVRLMTDYVETPFGVEEIEAVAQILTEAKEERDRQKKNLRRETEGEDDEETLEAQKRQDIQEIFELFDVDGGGTIDTEEFSALLDELCIPMTEDEVDELMASLDTDGSGDIDFDEFYTWFDQTAEQQQKSNRMGTLFKNASQLYKGMQGLRVKMEAKRLLIAVAEFDTQELARAEFRKSRPPLHGCPHCCEAFVEAGELETHIRKRKFHRQFHQTRKNALAKFEPVWAVFRGPLGRKFRANRLLYHGDIVPQESRLDAAMPQPFRPLISDPTERRSKQLRMGLNVEGYDPTVGKRPGHRQRGMNTMHLKPSPANIRTFPQTLLKLYLDNENLNNAPPRYIVPYVGGRAKVTFGWLGKVRYQIAVVGEFTQWRPMDMIANPDDGHYYLSRELSAGMYRYYFLVDGVPIVSDYQPHEGEGVRAKNYVVVHNPVNANERGGTLEAVEVPSMGIADDGAWALAQLVGKSHNVVLLDISHNHISDDGAEALALAIRETTTIRVLKCNANNIGYDGMRALARALNKNSSVEDVEFAANPLGDDAAEEVGLCLNGHKTIVRLNMDDCAISDDGAKTMAMTMLRNCTLRELSLRNNNITATGAKYMAQLLENNGSLLNLYLARNPLGPEGAEHIGTSLRANDSLLRLDLAHTGICDRSATFGIYAIAMAMKENKALLWLDMTGNSITNWGGLELCDALRVNETLRDCVMDFNELDDHWVQPMTYIQTHILAQMPSIETSMQRNRDAAKALEFGLSQHAKEREEVFLHKLEESKAKWQTQQEAVAAAQKAAKRQASLLRTQSNLREASLEQQAKEEEEEAVLREQDSRSPSPPLGRGGSPPLGSPGRRGSLSGSGSGGLVRSGSMSGSALGGGTESHQPFGRRNSLSSSALQPASTDSGGDGASTVAGGPRRREVTEEPKFAGGSAGGGVRRPGGRRRKGGGGVIRRRGAKPREAKRVDTSKFFSEQIFFDITTYKNVLNINILPEICPPGQYTDTGEMVRPELEEDGNSCGPAPPQLVDGSVDDGSFQHDEHHDHVDGDPSDAEEEIKLPSKEALRIRKEELLRQRREAIAAREARPFSLDELMQDSSDVLHEQSDVESEDDHLPLVDRIERKLDKALGIRHRTHPRDITVTSGSWSRRRKWVVKEREVEDEEKDGEEEDEADEDRERAEMLAKKLEELQMKAARGPGDIKFEEEEPPEPRTFNMDSKATFERENVELLVRMAVREMESFLDTDDGAAYLNEVTKVVQQYIGFLPRKDERKVPSWVDDVHQAYSYAVFAQSPEEPDDVHVEGLERKRKGPVLVNTATLNKLEKEHIQKEEEEARVAALAIAAEQEALKNKKSGIIGWVKTQKDRLQAGREARALRKKQEMRRNRKKRQKHKKGTGKFGRVIVETEDDDDEENYKKTEYGYEVPKIFNPNLPHSIASGQGGVMQAVSVELVELVGNHLRWQWNLSSTFMRGKRTLALLGKLCMPILIDPEQFERQADSLRRHSVVVPKPQPTEEEILLNMMLEARLNKRRQKMMRERGRRRTPHSAQVGVADAGILVSQMEKQDARPLWTKIMDLLHPNRARRQQASEIVQASKATGQAEAERKEEAEQLHRGVRANNVPPRNPPGLQKGRKAIARRLSTMKISFMMPKANPNTFDDERLRLDRLLAYHTDRIRLLCRENPTFFTRLRTKKLRTDGFHEDARVLVLAQLVSSSERYFRDRYRRSTPARFACWECRTRCKSLQALKRHRKKPEKLHAFEHEADRLHQSLSQFIHQVSFQMHGYQLPLFFEFAPFLEQSEQLQVFDSLGPSRRPVGVLERDNTCVGHEVYGNWLRIEYQEQPFRFVQFRTGSGWHSLLLVPVGPSVSRLDVDAAGRTERSLAEIRQRRKQQKHEQLKALNKDSVLEADIGSLKRNRGELQEVFEEKQAWRVHPDLNSKVVVKVRALPNADGRVIGDLSVGMVVEAFGKVADQWLGIRFETNDLAWVRLRVRNKEVMQKLPGLSNRKLRAVLSHSPMTVPDDVAVAKKDWFGNYPLDMMVLSNEQIRRTRLESSTLDLS